MGGIERLAETGEFAEALAARMSKLARLQSSNAAPNEIAGAAVAVLESAAMTGESAWRRLMLDNRLDEIERLLFTPEFLLAGLEQELLASHELGLRERAIAMIEALGHREASVAREAERLLHAAGESDGAYRIERAHKSLRSPRRPRPRSPLAPPLNVAVAGGHPRLRAMIQRDLSTHHIREIPSKHEASIAGRDVAAKLAGSDLVVVIVRQIAHSTTDRVVAAAAKQGVPVAFARSASIASVRGEVDRFAREMAGVT